MVQLQEIAHQVLSDELMPLWAFLAEDGVPSWEVEGAAMSLLPGWFFLHTKFSDAALRGEQPGELKGGHGRRKEMVSKLVSSSRDLRTRTMERSMSAAESVAEVMRDGVAEDPYPTEVLPASFSG